MIDANEIINTATYLATRYYTNETDVLRHKVDLLESRIRELVSIINEVRSEEHSNRAG
jgi:ubiquinone biosynthesis protein UbiJ